MKKANTLSRQLDFNQRKIDNEVQSFNIHRVEGDKQWKELKDMKEYIKEEVKRIVEKKEEGWQKEK